MRLLLSSAAAPDGSPGELLDGCVRRGLAGLEHVGAPERGFRSDRGDSAVEVSSAASGLALELCGLYCSHLEPDQVDDAARLGGLLGTPVVVPVEGFDRPLLPRAAESFAAAGARLLLSHGSDPGLAAAIRYIIAPLPFASAVGLAWELRPGVDDPRHFSEVIDAAGDTLHYVRLHGGGPEAHAQGGMGIGVLMARLTLARYAGPIVLTPSNPSYHYAWNAWLGRAGGWGCGSKQADASLLTLAATGTTITTR